MVAATYDAAMVRVFADEGGYTNDPVDPGGATNWGITIHDARKYWKPDAVPNDVRNMPKSVAADIYRKHYANPMRYDELPAGVDYSVLDAAINSGVGRAPQWLARALGVSNEPIGALVGPALRYGDKVALIQKYWAVRLSFLRGLGTFWRFGKGWTRRCTQGEAAAVRMWLTIGARMPATDAREALDDEARKAEGASRKAGTGAATTGSGSAVGASALDWSHMSIWELLLAGAAVVFFVGVVAALVRQVIIHNQRAAAYAEA